MKKLTLVSVLLLFCTGLFAQIRDYVGVVRQQYYPDYVDFLEDLSSSFKSRGLTTYSKYIDSYLNGTFGSGFVFVDDDGTNYVITNNHVVNQAASASIEFEDEETGVITRYENLSIIITDDDIDIAVLQFDGNKKVFEKGLVFSEEKLTDGTEVVSAGFPGLGGEPVWQLGKGSVTNASARIKELIDPSISTIIQHSAQVDGGNSGGPLMISSKKESVGYEVVGINTWKAAGRESTNFALPASLAKDMIERSKNPVSDNVAKAMRLDALKKILEDPSSDFTSIVKFISYECAAALGESDFVNIVNYGSTDVRNKVLSEFSYNPMEGLRYAVAVNFFNEYHGENATFEKLEDLKWIREHGVFRLNLERTSKTKKNAKNSKKTDSIRTIPEVRFEGLFDSTIIAVNAGMSFPFKEESDSFNIKPGFNASLETFPWNSGIFGFGVGTESKKIDENNFVFMEGDVILRLPLNFNLFSITPRVLAGAGVSMSNGGMMTGFVEAGMEVTLNLGFDYFRPGINAGYRISSFNLSETNESYESKNLVVNFCAGFVF